MPDCSFLCDDSSGAHLAVGQAERRAAAHFKMETLKLKQRAVEARTAGDHDKAVAIKAQVLRLSEAAPPRCTGNHAMEYLDYTEGPYQGGGWSCEGWCAAAGIGLALRNLALKSHSIRERYIGNYRKYRCIARNWSAP